MRAVRASDAVLDLVDGSVGRRSAQRRAHPLPVVRMHEREPVRFGSRPMKSVAGYPAMDVISSVTNSIRYGSGASRER